MMTAQAGTASGAAGVAQPAASLGEQVRHLSEFRFVLDNPSAGLIKGPWSRIERSVYGGLPPESITGVMLWEEMFTVVRGEVEQRLVNLQRPVSRSVLVREDINREEFVAAVEEGALGQEPVDSVLGAAAAWYGERLTGGTVNIGGLVVAAAQASWRGLGEHDHNPDFDELRTTLFIPFLEAVGCEVKSKHAAGYCQGELLDVVSRELQFALEFYLFHTPNLVRPVVILSEPDREALSSAVSGKTFTQDVVDMLVNSA